MLLPHRGPGGCLSPSQRSLDDRQENTLGRLPVHHSPFPTITHFLISWRVHRGPPWMQIFPSAKCIRSAIWVYFKSLSLTTHVKNLDLSQYVQEVWRSSPQKEISLMAESQIWQHWDGIMEVAYRILYSRALKMSDVSNENIYIWGTAVGWSDGSVRIRVTSSAFFAVRPENDNDRPNLEDECTRSSGSPSVSREVSLAPLPPTPPPPPLWLHIINLPGANVKADFTGCWWGLDLHICREKGLWHTVGWIDNKFNWKYLVTSSDHILDQKVVSWSCFSC